MIYAPVMITTLNRYKHFVRCVTSLQKNSWAEKTEIFISLDYPPSEQYVEGYKKIKAYLEKGVSGFKKVHIFYQKINLGMLDNATYLQNKVFESFDRLISLEDDNELSPCFLEFCDKGLELFENDDSVVALNASNYVWCANAHQRDFAYSGSNNVRKRQLLFHACAFWKDKVKVIQDMCEKIEFYSMGKDIRKMLKLRRKSSAFFYTYIENILFSRTKLPWHKGKLYSIDFIWDIYMMLNDCYVIYPVIAQTRDWGTDGSGVNYIARWKNQKELLQLPINSELHFEYKISEPIDIDTEEVRLHDKNVCVHLKSRLKRLAMYLNYLVTNKKL